jgi:hypothetical protein
MREIKRTTRSKVYIDAYKVPVLYFTYSKVYKKQGSLIIRPFNIILNVIKAKGDLDLIFRLAGDRAATSRNGKAADAGQEATREQLAIAKISVATATAKKYAGELLPHANMQVSFNVQG